MKYISLGLRALLTIAFVGAGGAKLAGAEMMVLGLLSAGVLYLHRAQIPAYLGRA